MTVPEFPADGLFLKVGETRFFVSEKIPNPKTAEEDEGIQIEVVKDGKIIASTDNLLHCVKVRNSYKTLFTACKKLNLTDTVSDIKRLAKDHKTESSYQTVAAIGEPPKYYCHVAFNIDGKKKPSYRFTIVLRMRVGEGYHVTSVPVNSPDEVIENLLFTIETLANGSLAS